jgi:hypothetical protein
MKTIVYRNLHPGRPTWSHATLRGNVGKGIVTDRADSYVMRGVQFHWIRGTQEAIKAKFEASGQRDRSVHAWSIGEVIRAAPLGSFLEVTYNPYRRGGFHTRDGRTVTRADYVVFARDGKAYAINAR